MSDPARVFAGLDTKSSLHLGYTKKALNFLEKSTFSKFQYVLFDKLASLDSNGVRGLSDCITSSSEQFHACQEYEDMIIFTTKITINVEKETSNKTILKMMINFFSHK